MNFKTDKSPQNYILWPAINTRLRPWIVLDLPPLPSLHSKAIRTIAIFRSRHWQYSSRFAILLEIFRLVYSRGSLSGISLHSKPLQETLDWSLSRGEYHFSIFFF